MGLITILGTSHSVPDLNHGNTHFLVQVGSSKILVDCAGDIIQRLQRIDVNICDITDLIITHFHPDHAIGVPLFLMDSWMIGRKDSLNLRGLPHTLDSIKANMELYKWQDWPDFFPVRFLPIAEEENVIVHETRDFRITASPVEHLTPTICLKFEFLRSEKSFLYSSDTEPCPALVRLARDVDVLLHEATGAHSGHTSAVQAAEIAQKADAKSLYLIHYPLRGSELEIMLAEAQGSFEGPVQLAQDFMTLEFN